MARQIANTPTISGDDAKKFRKELIKTISRVNKKRTPQEELAKRKKEQELAEHYKLFMSISNDAL